MSFHVPNQHRVTTGHMATTNADGNNGQFWISSLKLKRALFVQASDGAGWEHVSVSVYNRTPTWAEMQYVKDLFWDSDDVVVQFHPPRSEYVNCHPYCLHMWRKAGSNDFCERPPAILVGPQRVAS